jgi:type VI secretion system protein ImpC
VNLDVSAGSDQTPAKPLPDEPFRILLVGDFSGHTHWRPVEVDRDNLDDVMSALGASALGIGFQRVDDFHPDHLYEELPAFQALRETRRRLLNPKTFHQAAGELRAAMAPPAKPSAPPPPAAKGGSLLDQMLDDAEPAPVPKQSRGADLQDFVRQAVESSLVPDDDPELPALLAAIDETCGKMMRAILHHPDFQATEAAWRAVQLLTWRLETGSSLKVYLLDVSKEALLEDISGDVELSRFHELLVERDDEPWALVAANCSFSWSDADVAVLRRLAGILQAAGAPLLAEADPQPEPGEQWAVFRDSPAARWVSLAMPRFLLRLPYGERSSALESFPFEEMPEEPGHGDYLWGNPAFALALLMGEAFTEMGWDLRPGAVRAISDLPIHVYTSNGESVMKPCAEMWMTEDDAVSLMDEGLVPLVSIRNLGEVRVLRFQSLGGELAGRWG